MSDVGSDVEKPSTIKVVGEEDAKSFPYSISCSLKHLLVGCLDLPKIWHCTQEAPFPFLFLSWELPLFSFLGWGKVLFWRKYCKFQVELDLLPETCFEACCRLDTSLKEMPANLDRFS